MENTEIIQQCNEFLGRSSRRYSSTLSRATSDMNRYSGQFWDDDFKKQYRTGENRIYLTLNNWNVICNAIASPMSASPWHTELKDRTGENNQIQEAIDTIEARNDVKSSYLDAFRKCVLSGCGFVVVSTDLDELTGEPIITLESVKHLKSVALDPNVNTVDGSDAEEGAIINFIGLRKARRLYGDDVAPFDFPRTAPLLNLSGLQQWGCPEDQIAIVSYYTKENDGVHYYKICGNKVVEDNILPIKYIPIIRFAGNEIYEGNEINYDGIVRQTIDLELGANQAYSTLIERCGRSVKASYLMHVSAADGTEKSVANANKADSAVVFWAGEHEPKPIIESFQTGDLQSVITTTRTLMEDVVGVPLTGIPGQTPEKTATEILRQQTSKESNTANYFNNAFTATNTIAKLFIELLTGGNDLRYSLENGPSVITRQIKARQEIASLSTICPDDMKGILAVYFARTLEDDTGKDITKNMIANLPPNIQFLERDTEADPVALHQLQQMKLTLDQAMQQLDEVGAQNAELQKQLDAANLNLMENREQRILDWNKFNVQEQDKMALETMKLQQNGAMDASKLQLDAAKLMQQAESEQIRAMQEHDRTLADMQGQIAEAEDRGYEQGVNDGVDAAYDRV